MITAQPCVIADLIPEQNRRMTRNPKRFGDAGVRRHDGAIAAKSRWNFFYLFILPFLVLMFFSCANDMEVVNKFVDTESEPDMTGTNFKILYTDSARLQMKMLAPLLLQYSSAKEQRDECPEGLHVWFYEKTGELKAELTANWAKRDYATELWEARGNVVIINAEGRKLETEQLFWEPKKGIVYSEKYTKITNEDGTVAWGDKFNATQDLSKYQLIQGKASIVLKEDVQN